MQHELHPNRYRETMSAAILRLESIAKDHGSPERLAAEFAGMTQNELTACGERLNEIEPGIARWAERGKSVFDVTAIPGGLLSAEPAPFDLDADFFERSVYVHFGLQEQLRLNAPSGDAIDGFYIHKVSDGSAYELTFVCSGPEWTSLELGPYSDALRCASRIATLRTGVGMPFPASFPAEAFKGDSGLLTDGALDRAVSAARVVLSILRRQSPVVG